MWDVDIKENGMKRIQELCELSLQLSCRSKIILKLKDYLKKKPHLLTVIALVSLHCHNKRPEIWLT